VSPGHLDVGNNRGNFELRQRAKKAARLNQIQDEEAFLRGTRWLFVARTSHAPKNGLNGGFD
jgi:hypothetical protein